MKDYNQALAYEILIKKEYSFADEELRSARCIFDIGGHQGYFGQYCLDLGSKADIFVFEPLKFPAPDLQNHPQIHWHQLGLAAQAGEELFYANPTKSMQSSKFTQTFLNPHGEPKTCPVISLESALHICKYNQINVLKIDIEGMEYEVLSALPDACFAQIDCIILEYHLLTPGMESDFPILEARLRQFYPSLQHIPSPYSTKVGYLWCQRG